MLASVVKKYTFNHVENMLGADIKCTFEGDKNFFLEFFKNDNKVYIKENSNITDFNKFKLLCEQMEHGGYRLNIAESCYER